MTGYQLVAYIIGLFAIVAAMNRVFHFLIARRDRDLDELHMMLAHKDAVSDSPTDPCCGKCA